MIGHGHRYPDILDYTLAQMTAHVAATQRYRGRQAALLACGLRTAAWGDEAAMSSLVAALTGKPAPAGTDQVIGSADDMAEFWPGGRPE